MTSHETLAAALAAVQANLPKLVKGETAKVTGESKTGAKVSYSYGYAGLDQVVEAVLPALGENGLSISSKTTITDGGGFMLEVALLHEKGEREIGYWPLPDPRRSGPQEIGSAMTYGRRYLTLALTGTFPGGEDDDGAKAQNYAQQERWDNAKPKAADKPVSAPPAPAKDWTKATDDEIRDLHKRIENLPIGQAVNGYDWMAANNLHNRQLPFDGADDVLVTATDVLAIRIADEAVKPDVPLEYIATLVTYAETRGLMKMQVSEATTLGEELAMARDTKTAASGDDGGAQAAMQGTGD
jgi:hypothetical protein